MSCRHVELASASPGKTCSSYHQEILNKIQDDGGIKQAAFTGRITQNAEPFTSS